MPDNKSLLTATPTGSSLFLRRADFATLAEALDYAAQGETGANFYSGGGKLVAALPYRLLRQQSLMLARRLLSLGLERGARVAVVAETNPDFLRFFFACQYSGLVPVALPATVNLGGHAAYVAKLRGLLRGCSASVAMASNDFIRFLNEAAEGMGLAFVGTPSAFEALPEVDAELKPGGPDEISYLQYTSGSTGFPRGVVITQRIVMANLFGVANHGVDMRADDRCVSWLPFYHDMGLVGCMMALVATQRSVDYIDTRDFAMRPRRWLELMTSSRATIAFSPPFGFELCSRRIRAEDVARYDLSAWRVAGVGAEPIHAETLTRFAELLAPAGFDPRAFVPCYGMAESSLAISFMPLQHGVVVDWVDADDLAENLHATPVEPGKGAGFVRCGVAMPGHEIEILDEQDKVLPDFHVGLIKVRGPSVMTGYFRLPEETKQALSPDGWLDTGDIGYMVDGNIVVTGRHKDMLIINGRNIWPQDIERIVERQPELRSLDASAFSVPGPNNDEIAVTVVQCNITDPAELEKLTQRLHREIHEEIGIACIIEFVPRHTLPRTSSGKLSRSATKVGYLRRREQEALQAKTETSSAQQPAVAPDMPEAGNSGRVNTGAPVVEIVQGHPA